MQALSEWVVSGGGWWLPTAALAVAGPAVGLGLLGWQRRFVHRQQAARQAAVRRGIAADLHDELGSLLLQITLHGEVLLNAPRADGEAGLLRLLAVSRAASAALRDVAWGLDAGADTLHALQDRMSELLGELAPGLPPHAHFTSHGLDGLTVLPGPLRKEVFLVFKEAVTNVARHARAATTLSVRLCRDAHGLVLEVEDDGAAAAAPASRGMGLRNMQLRAQAVGGHLDAGPRPDGPGFRVRFTTPLQPGPAAAPGRGQQAAAGAATRCHASAG